MLALHGELLADVEVIEVEFRVGAPVLLQARGDAVRLRGVGIRIVIWLRARKVEERADDLLHLGNERAHCDEFAALGFEEWNVADHGRKMILRMSCWLMIEL